ncbi:LamG-like jellyroll fold domain-containing protein [Salinibacterium sp.]|uniref:LamG-like jellyroll fold domain-containing protein n=1 Tax=Salinibacterium sp. TaxID=1915057 RepID=UPI00286C63F3|nr:LamG-like jellyroll fold domain-containing protein [Salinibacterium sp.]
MNLRRSIAVSTVVALLALGALSAPAQAAGPVPAATYTPRIAGPWTTLFSPTQPAPANYMNDHTVIKGGDGLWHVIGISGGGNGQENSFASATTASLTSGTWTEGPVLAAYYANGTPLNAWAPHAITVGGTTYLFYRSNRAGVPNNTSPGGNTLEVASTTDPTLTTWTRRTDITVSGLSEEFRDPMVYPYNGGYVMYAPATANGVNYLASYTSTNLLDWVYAGRALTVSGTATTAPWSSLESPFVFKYGDYYYLSTTITDSSAPSYHDTFIFRSTNPMDFGDFNGVSATGAGTLVAKLPVHAPEYIQDTNGQWYITTSGWQNYAIYPEASHGVAIAPLAFTNDAHTVPSNNKVLGYQFDDQTGAVDSSGNSRTGTLAGDATFATAGHTGGALSTSTGSVTLPPVSYAGNFTVAGWIRTDTAPSNANGLVSGIGQDINLYQGYPRLYTGTDVATSSVAVAANTWAHVAVTRSGTTVTTYVNGIARGTGTWSGIFTPKFAGRAIAKTGPQAIDDFVLAGRALSSTEVQQLAQAAPTIPSGLDILYGFSSTPTGSVTDSSGQGRNGVASGSYVWRRDGQFAGSFTANSGGSGAIALPAISITGDFSIAAWVNPSAGLTNTSGLLRGSGMDINFYQGKPRLYAGSDRVTATKVIPTGAWTHVVITRTAGTVKLYLDGTLDSQGTWSGTFAPTMVGGSLAGNVSIGLDELYIYDRALTATEIAQLG